MLRAEHQDARSEHRTARTLFEGDLLLSVNLDLARRQQRIPVALLAERAGLSMPTVTKMLRTGNGSFENFLRIARLLGLLDGVQQATDPLNTDIGKLRADEDTPKRIR